MKPRNVALLLLAACFLTLLGLVQQPAVAQEIVSENLFENPGFEAGYYNQNQIAQIAVPNGWRMHWIDDDPFPGTGGLPAYRPETVVWNIQDAPEDERSLFFRDGSYTLKVFKSWAPLYAGISQDVNGLEVGRKYRIVAPIYVDIVEDYDGGSKVAPSRMDAGFVRFGAGPVGVPWLSADQINYSPYWTAENVQPFYQAMPIFVWDFTATSENMTIFIEMGSNYPYRNNGFFMDGVGLYALDVTGSVPAGSGNNNSGGGGGAPPAQSGPTATPFPTPTPRPDGAIVHVVNSGDTFWSIAIRYAPALNMTPEEALPAIRSLNNDPAFLNVGQEILIREAGAAPAVEEPAEETVEEAETTESEAETAEEVIVVEGEGETEETAEAEAIAAVPETESADTTETVGSICVTAFNDANANGARDQDAETLQADAAITLFRAGSTVSTYISDGISEPYCFENLEPDTYQVQIFPPADYQPTTSNSWAVALSEGVMIPVSFGIQYAPPAAEEAAVADTGETAVDAEAPTEADTAEAPAEDGGGFFGSVVGIVVIVAVVLVLLAGVGVVMLRRA